MSGIRQSKFKHVYGKPYKRDACYEGIAVTKGTHDSQFCAVNPKYLAVITEKAGGGCFAIIPIESTGRLPNDLPVVSGHTAPVLDIKWSPFDYDIIGSCSEDCSIRIWRIPLGGITADTNLESHITLLGHQRRVNLILWHPTAESIIVSSGGDNQTIIWNLETQSILQSVELPNIVTSMSFSLNGSKLATCCRDGLTRVMNPRNGEIITTGTCHEGKKPQQCIFLTEDRLVTTGFSRMSERQLALWDFDKLDTCLWNENIDITNGVLFPFYDPDTQLIFVCGKGDSTIRYFEYCPEDKAIYYLNRFDTSHPQRGFGLMPKLGLNTANNEIARVYKLHNLNWCEVIPFIVPRRSNLFQDDLYPDTAAPQPALTATEWISGKDAYPILVSIKSCQKMPLPTPSVNLPTVQNNTPSVKHSTSPVMAPNPIIVHKNRDDSNLDRLDLFERKMDDIMNHLESLEHRLLSIENKINNDLTASSTSNSEIA